MGSSGTSLQRQNPTASTTGRHRYVTRKSVYYRGRPSRGSRVVSRSVCHHVPLQTTTGGIPVSSSVPRPRTRSVGEGVEREEPRPWGRLPRDDVEDLRRRQRPSLDELRWCDVLHVEDPGRGDEVLDDEPELKARLSRTSPRTPHPGPTWTTLSLSPSSRQP